MLDIKHLIKKISEMIKKFVSLLLQKIKNLKPSLKWGTLTALIAVISFYITLQMNKPFITLKPEQFGDCKCYLAAGIKDGKPASQTIFTVMNTGNVAARNIQIEWYVSEAYTKTVGPWTLSQNHSKKMKIDDSMDLEPDGRYIQGATWFFDPKMHSIKDILHDFNSNNGYLTFNVTVEYQNGLFPFIKHKLIVRDRFFNKKTRRFTQEYSFY